MFLVKKYVSRLLFPLPLCCELIVVGMLLIWLSKRQRLGKSLLGIGVLLLLLLSNGAISDFLLAPLETRYPPLTDPAALNRDSETPIRWVAVLGGGYCSDENLPATSRLEPDSLSRLAEGVRVQKALPGSQLLLSVGANGSEVAEVAVSIAGMIGLRREDLRIIQGALDTRDEVGLMNKTIGPEPFVLVTSASHMPRAVALFQSAGMKPLPAPTDFWVKGRAGYEHWLPSGSSLLRSERAFYEYLGLAWMRLGG
jgi:uncharacterized SAM-binding protein YcdF (DUF218 family)